MPAKPALSTPYQPLLPLQMTARRKHARRWFASIAEPAVGHPPATVTQLFPDGKHLVSCGDCGEVLALIPRLKVAEAYSEERICDPRRRLEKAVYYCRPCTDARYG